MLLNCGLSGDVKWSVVKLAQKLPYFSSRKFLAQIELAHDCQLTGVLFIWRIFTTKHAHVVEETFGEGAIQRLVKNKIIESFLLLDGHDWLEGICHQQPCQWHNFPHVYCGMRSTTQKILFIQSHAISSRLFVILQKLRLHQKLIFMLLKHVQKSLLNIVYAFISKNLYFEQERILETSSDDCAGVVIGLLKYLLLKL